MSLTVEKLTPSSNYGFLLTRQAYDTKQGIELSLWVKTLQGAVNIIVQNQQALFFVEQRQQVQAQSLLSEQRILTAKVNPLALKTFNQQLVSGFYFSTMRDFYRARDALKQAQIKCYEDDFRPDERFLMERFITSGIEFIPQSIAQPITELPKQFPQSNFATFYCNKCRATDKAQLLDDIALTMVSLDIECSMAGELYSIGLHSHKMSDGKSIKCVLMIGDQNNVIAKATQSKLSDEEATEIAQHIVWLDNEQALLAALIAWIKTHDPDIFIGWNVINFDFNLLQKRCDIYNIAFNIGRNAKSPRWRTRSAGGSQNEQKFIDVAGRVVLDGIDLLKNATYNFPSFSLDFVANALLGKGKKVDDVDNRMQEINDNFADDKLALAAYNLEDCHLVTLIFEQSLLLEFTRLRAKLTGLSIDRIGGSVAAFTNLYLPKLHRSGYIAPNMGDGLQGLVSPGGYVMDSIPGLYKNVLVLDFKSLYPSIIRSFNIDPMGLIEGLKSPKNSIKGFDGAYFSRDKHFLPEIINELWLERDIAKKDKNAALSQAIKIIMNSFYGVLGSTGCRFFDPRLSGSITKRSHELLITTKMWLEDDGYQVIYGDTDSIFVSVDDDLTLQQCQTLGKALQDKINLRWQATLKKDFAIESQLEIEFETHFSQFLMPTIRGQDVGTKKRYAGMVEKKGTSELIFKGLESVRTDWTELAKTFQRELYLKIFNGEPFADYVRSIVAQTSAGQLDHLLVYRKRIRRQLDHYIKNVPPHVKAARLADDINKINNQPQKYQQRGWIEYLITTSGPQAKGYVNAPLDYQFYIDRQLATVADAILPFVGSSFEKLTSDQMNLFQ
ncbi:DNA polymerase II [Colwellia hornerae]|uniref:DNA polymerase n=1 Tax=Colwellia hornerae TaxID=89402 RepID=A0A5C6QFC4_9GAMM|nr:DNA polymerase II [Colwellia hornerae]TWX52278.1 DNA polymerase II [Colwellia hornerae]TWX57837.1 DNA polymerase II [Colwellia hornerae]TWX67539.1 DNA polymerase II [Colwellia hornerae]